MRKIKDVLRLKLDAKLSHQQIADALGLSKGVVTKYAGLAAAADAGIGQVRRKVRYTNVALAIAFIAMLGLAGARDRRRDSMNNRMVEFGLALAFIAVVLIVIMLHLGEWTADVLNSIRSSL